jgi:hypothetical protein
MPIGSQDKLESLYDLQRLLKDETARLENARDSLESTPNEIDHRPYIFELQIEALREEFIRISARISDILERDLQR